MSLTDRLVGRGKVAPSIQDMYRELFCHGGLRGALIAQSLVRVDDETDVVDDPIEAEPSFVKVLECFTGLVWAIAQSSAEQAQVIAMLPDSTSQAAKVSAAKKIFTDVREGYEDAAVRMSAEVLLVDQGEPASVAKLLAAAQCLYAEPPIVTEAGIEHSLEVTASTRALRLNKWFIPMTHRRTLFYLEILPLQARAQVAHSLRRLAGAAALNMQSAIKESLGVQKSVWTSASDLAKTRAAEADLRNEEKHSMDMLFRSLRTSLSVLVCLQGGMVWSLAEANRTLAEGQALPEYPPPVDQDVLE